MLSLLEVAERSVKGPRLEEGDWNLRLFRSMRELARKYEIQVPADPCFFNFDPALVDRAFAAAVDFLSEIGVYCISTGRVIKFSQEEVLAVAKEAPTEVGMGEGRDRRVFRQRKIEGREPLNHSPGHHAPYGEDMAPLVTKNLAQIASADYLEGFNFPVVDGREIHGLPLEAYAARREIAWMREGVRKAGRPGLAIALYPISTRAGALLAPLGGDAGLRPTDGVMLSVLPDVKVEHDLLTAAIIYGDYGCFAINGGAVGFVGGFAGGVEGAIIEAVVKALAGALVYRDYICQVSVGRMGTPRGWKSIAADPVLAWATSVACQALNTHTRTICMLSQGGQSSPGTEGGLREVALQAIRLPINGENVYHTRLGGGTKLNESATPFEAEWAYEVARATIRSRLDRARADDLLRKLAECWAVQPSEAPVDVRACYDWVRHQPSADYREKYLRVKDDLARLGLDFG